MNSVDATGNRHFGGAEDGVGRGRQLGADPVFRLAGFEMNHPDLGQLLQQCAEREVLQFLLPAYDAKKRHLDSSFTRALATGCLQMGKKTP